MVPHTPRAIPSRTALPPPLPCLRRPDKHHHYRSDVRTGDTRAYRRARRANRGPHSAQLVARAPRSRADRVARAQPGTYIVRVVSCHSSHSRADGLPGEPPASARGAPALRCPVLAAMSARASVTRHGPPVRRRERACYGYMSTARGDRALPRLQFRLTRSSWELAHPPDGTRRGGSLRAQGVA